jgi:prevent-host-death family protein
MRSATLTEAKNRLSALVDLVRQGETVVLLDRGRPVARIVPAVIAAGEDPEGRLARLERAGLVRRAAGPATASTNPVPRVQGSVLGELLAERAEAR